LRTLKQKARYKAARYPNVFDLNEVLTAKTFKAFDNHFTAPINGFHDALDYWYQSSSIHFLDNIKVPTLLVNAHDDSFLSKECFPIATAQRNANFYLEMPRYGGHLGFMSPDKSGFLWTEKRAFAFATMP
jgi:predicted alpha/beta-fold hydrolase